MRLQAVGMALDCTFSSPFSQTDLGDATGLSTVHVNRVLQELRRRNLIELSRTRFVALDWKGLVEIAGFDGAYLHQLGRPTTH